MAGYLPSNDFANVQHSFRHSDRPDKIASVTYTVAGFSTQPLQTAAEQLHEDFWFRWGPLFDNGVTSTDTTVYLGPTPSENVAVVTDPAAGASTATKPPPSVNILLHKMTGFAGKRNRGRMYLPWIASEAGVNEAGQVLASTITTVTTVANDWLTDLDIANLPMYIAHSEPTLGNPRLVTSITVAPLIATQRRRIRG